MSSQEHFLFPQHLPSLALFDMDGLMFDTETLSMQGWFKAGEAFGFTLEPERFFSTKGLTVDDTKKILMERIQSDELFEQSRQVRDNYVLEYVRLHGTPLMPGLVELLDCMDRLGMAKVVATSTEIERGQELLRCSGIFHRFDGVVYGNMVARGKPHPDIFLMAAEVGGQPPNRCVVLEDSNAGVEAAYRAGIPPIMVCEDPGMVDDNSRKKSLFCFPSLDWLIPVLESCRKDNGSPIVSI